MSVSAPAVCILPYEIKLGVFPSRLELDKCQWPLGQPNRLVGKLLHDLEPSDHLLISPRSSLHWRPGFGTRAKVSLYFQEPAAIHGHHMRKLRRSYRRFHRVLHFCREFVASLPNGLHFPLGGTFVPDWAEHSNCQKTRMVSLIASAKRSQVGHGLRHAIVDWAAETGVGLDVMGRGYKTLERQADGLAPYRYSVVIENVQERDYFSEKLIDAILCKTVPIYWGCPNIGDYFDPGLMIVCNSEQELRAAVLAADQVGFEDRRNALEAAKPDAIVYSDIAGRAARSLLAADR
ncbi:glycosyltransferase family 10 domain-containing protein [Thalassobius sp. MITS945101]|uniref:glycosyltransferase family 10 domain-containing protein n=1 Tax=Thalassobius sp. MITS945101 TaxID=3096994 RepID=UPI00399C32A6